MTALLTGKVVLISGGTQGLGAGIARAAAREGAVLVLSGRNAARGEEVAAELRAAGTDAAFARADISDVAQAQAAVAATIERHGRIDCLVNAAGVALFDDDGSVFEIEERIWELTMRVNLDGMRLMTRAMLPLLREGGRKSIVNIASTAGLRNMDSPLDAYQVSKAAVVSLSRAMAIQLGPEGIRCNTVCPGATLTPMIAHLYERSPERRVDMEQRTPLRRLGLPQDMADSVSFLCSERASFITAADLVVDGGWTAQIK